MQFPTRVPTQSVVLSHLNQPFLPSLSLSATQLLGVAEPRTTPATGGFASAFAVDQIGTNRTADHENERDVLNPNGPLPKTIRDLELALNANWREIGDDAKKVLGRQRDQLENKTGMEVAVLAL